MNQDKAIDPKNPIDPTKTTKKGNVELTEEQLGKASGGRPKGGPVHGGWDVIANKKA
jgi:hypothetical protein